jgi:hypothetical protein
MLKGKEEDQKKRWVDKIENDMKGISVCDVENRDE